MTTTAIRVSERAHPSATFDAAIPFVGRALLSAIFLASVVGKLQAPAGTIGYIAAMGLHIVHMGEFAWHAMEPAEGKFDLDWLDHCVTLAKRRKLDVP